MLVFGRFLGVLLITIGYNMKHKRLLLKKRLYGRTSRSWILANNLNRSWISGFRWAIRQPYIKVFALSWINSLTFYAKGFK
jgi:hypothetical protein